MEKLSTIQKINNLNTISCLNEVGPGGAYHDYLIEYGDTGNDQCIYFQKGPRHIEDSRYGILDEDLLEIVRHRLQCFQKGEFATRENAIALTHIEEVLLWLNKRKEDRLERGVLGTYNK